MKTVAIFLAFLVGFLFCLKYTHNDLVEGMGGQFSCPNLLDKAVYGLPEINRESISKASLIANPGCYPTSVILGLLPAVKYGLIETNSIIANAVSGKSGAGRKAVLSEAYSNFTESFKAYSPFSHRHLPEIGQVLEDYAKEINLVFTPHLAPMHRGIHTTLYVNTTTSFKKIKDHYINFYSNEKFVDVLKDGFCPLCLGHSFSVSFC